MPPTPSDVTPARRGSGPCGQSAQAVLTKSGPPSNAIRGFGRLVVQTRHEFAIAQHQRGLDQPGRSGRRVQMADITLHRANRTVALSICRLSKRFGQRGDLDRVAERSRGSVTFDIADATRPDARLRQGLFDGGDLAVDARSGKTDLASAVIAEAAPKDDGVDMIAVGDRVLEPLQEDDAAPLPKIVPLADASKGRQRPSADAIPPSWCR